MSEFKYRHLLSPIVIGRQFFRNRIFNSPTGVEIDPERYSCGYYERKAIGGAASVCVGDACPNEFGRARPSQINLWNEDEKQKLSDIAGCITRHGAVASIEILDAGNASTYSAMRGAPLYGPVAGVNAFGQEILEMTEEKILEVIEQHAKAALYAKRLGYGMVTIHGGHGWLITQFMDKNNNRKDKWGGSIENRARLAVAICDRIHQVCGAGYPVEMRMVGDEVYEGGYHIEYGIEQALQLEGHADLIHVSTGSHEIPEVFTVTHPSMFLGDGANVKYAAEIKKHVKTTPIATVGALSEPDLLEEIIASGQADVVEMARGLICDPDLPKKLMTGKEDEVRKCMRCLYCFSTHMRSDVIPCAINPEIGHEYEMHAAPVHNVTKKVLVIGGGMAGMEAAITAADNGHRVILCEKNDRLGGALLCEEKVPFKEKLGQYIALQARLISRRDIDVRLNTEVTPELISMIRPDAVICAIGARPVKPKIPGIDRDNVFGAEEIYYDPDKAGQNVVILGGGLVGLELAVWLTSMGRKCTVVEMLPDLNDGGNILHGLALGGEIRKSGIRVSTATKALEITDGGVVCEYTGAKSTPAPFMFTIGSFPPDGTEGKVTFPADTVIYAVGQRPLREEADAMRFVVPEFYQIGDCVMPKNIYEATHQGHYVARDLSR